eukprot:Protomagalhaensia_sp_Gyna_25__1112@NODE_1542_length_1753_cov_1305_731622_g1251_i0_p1_GENE_NODE_1542_length_1753_cov_1305_731622_g1251_i0NODE_1542_length_1753_cov_1305_731622_g1251_i0_p1_ORF_typecomplete_len328_score44_82_NODE_1542_length_1753_cov_1305_731622_g1251_i0681051
MLVFLLPCLKDDLPEVSNTEAAATLNCLGLSSAEIWLEELEAVQEEVRSVFHLEEDELKDVVQWDYSQSVSTRLAMIPYSVEAPLVNLWVGARTPIPEDKNLVDLLSSFAGPALEVDFKTIVETHRYFLRRSCKEDLRRLAKVLNEATAEEIEHLLMAPMVTPVRVLRSTLSGDQMTITEKAAYDSRQQRHGFNAEVFLDPLYKRIQEIDLCRRGWLKLTNPPKSRKGCLARDKQEEKLRQLTRTGTFAEKLEAQKTVYRVASPLPTLIQPATGETALLSHGLGLEFGGDILGFLSAVLIDPADDTKMTVVVKQDPPPFFVLKQSHK